MKKAKLLLCTSAVLLLASCGGGGTPAESSKAGGGETGGWVVPTSVKAFNELVDWSTIENQSDVDLLIWCDVAVKELVSNRVSVFAETVKKAGFTKNLTYTINEVSESKAAGQMLTDVEAGADVYFFAQDQLNRLITGGAIDEAPSLFTDYALYKNTLSSINAATYVDNGKNKLYAYPASEDNGYFMYYDGSKFTEEDVKNWETMVSKAETQKVDVHFNHGNAWYNFGWFYGAGADCEYTTDVKGNFISVNDTYDSAAGKIAARGMANVITSTAVVDNSAVADSGDKCAAIVSGTWDYENAQKKWGSNLKTAELPSFTVDGKAYHTGSFSGLKLIGVKPQETDCDTILAHLLGLYLSDYEAQKDRFDHNGWGPSNKQLLDSAEVKASPHLVALSKQAAYAKPQGQYPDGWWTLANAIGPAIAKVGKSATDAQLNEIIQAYKDGLDATLS